MRCVQLYRGFGRQEDEGTLRLMSGGTVRVWPGGWFGGREVVYREQPQTLAGIRRDLSDARNRRRTWGGTVLVMGGWYACSGCVVMRRLPYGNVLPNSIQVGRDILVVAGVAVNVGCYTTNLVAFTSSVNVGNNYCVLGGVAIWVGGGANAAAVMIGQFGTGEWRGEEGKREGGGLLVEFYLSFFLL